MLDLAFAGVGHGVCPVLSQKRRALLECSLFLLVPTSTAGHPHSALQDQTSSAGGEQVLYCISLRQTELTNMLFKS